MQEIKGIKSVLLKKRIPLTNIIGTDVFVALTILPVYRYVDGKRTDEVNGYKYDVVDEIKYDRYSIKVQGEPLMSNEELQAMREHEKVILQFEKQVYISTTIAKLSFMKTPIRQRLLCMYLHRRQKNDL